MISVHQALQIIEENVAATTLSKKVKMADALGYVLFDSVVSPINMPPFRQSAMDGYALRLNNEKSYSVVDEVKAGDGHHPALKEGDAVRIFTGAAVPDSANAVVMQEKVTRTGDKIQLEDSVTINANIRPLGEQVRQGAIALEKGTMLTPAAIGFLTTIGVTEVTVYTKPSVTVVTTGNELVPAGNPLERGQIYESNATMLLTALRSVGYSQVSICKVEDDYLKTRAMLQTVIQGGGVVLITGGISVGDYDFVGKALNELKVEQLFYKVKQKPGKPLFFGKKNETLVFALPGNPAAALSCFYIYVHKALQRLSGDLHFQPKKTKERSVSNFIKKGDRPQFLKGIYADGKVTLLEGQSSAMLQTFALANALVFVPEEVTEIKIDDIIDVIHLPN